jgi:hypothetical protein
MVLGLSLAVASPANAVPAGCTSGWSSWNTNYAAPFWGQVRWCSAYEGYGRYLQFQVQDIYTDGYSVHLEACTDTSTYTCTVGGYGDAFLPSWGHIILDSGSGGTCPQSSGAVDTTAWPSIGVPNNPPQNTTYVRLVRGRCSPHQDVASVYFRIQGI